MIGGTGADYILQAGRGKRNAGHGAENTQKCEPAQTAHGSHYGMNLYCEFILSRGYFHGKKNPCNIVAGGALNGNNLQ